MEYIYHIFREPSVQLKTPSELSWTGFSDVIQTPIGSQGERYVGSERVNLVSPQEMICRRLDFFEYTFKEGFKEASNRSPLNFDDSAAAFGLLVSNPHLVLPIKRSASTTIPNSTSLR